MRNKIGIWNLVNQMHNILKHTRHYLGLVMMKLQLLIVSFQKFYEIEV